MNKKIFLIPLIIIGTATPTLLLIYNKEEKPTRITAPLPKREIVQNTITLDPYNSSHMEELISTNQTFNQLDYGYQSTYQEKYLKQDNYIKMTGVKVSQMTTTTNGNPAEEYLDIVDSQKPASIGIYKIEIIDQDVKTKNSIVSLNYLNNFADGYVNAEALTQNSTWIYTTDYENWDNIFDVLNTTNPSTSSTLRQYNYLNSVINQFNNGMLGYRFKELYRASRNYLINEPNNTEITNKQISLVKGQNNYLITMDFYNYEDSAEDITLKTEPTTEMFLNPILKMTYQLLDDSGSHTGYEVVDIPGMMLTILTMPFTFVSQAFNFTLWEGTPYAINLSHMLLAILGALVLVFVILKLIKK